MTKPVKVHPKYGRLQFSTAAAKGHLIFAFAFIGGLALLAAFALYDSYEGFLRYILSLPLVFFAIWLMTRGPLAAREGASVFEKGLVLVSRKGSREVGFAQIRTIQYTALEVLVNGFHNHTRKGIVLGLHDTTQAGISQQVPKGDESFDRLRDLVSAHIADRMEKDMQRMGVVQWVHGVRIAPNELHMEGGFVHGVGQTRALPLDPSTKFSLHDGKCHISAFGSVEPALTLETNEENFYPGLELLRRMYSGARLASGAAAA